GFQWPNECTDEFLICGGGDPVCFRPDTAQQVFNLLAFVDPGRFNLDIFEPGASQLRLVFSVLECPCNASDPQLDVVPNLLGHSPANHNVRYRKASPRL